MTRINAPDRSNWLLLALDASQRGRLSPLKLQKTLFLLGARRPEDVAPNFYDFAPYHYGPFCAEIYHDADALAAQGLVELDNSRGQSLREYVITEAGRAYARAATQHLSAGAGQYLRDVVAWAEPLAFDQLVRAVYDAFPSMRINSIFS